MSGTNDGSPKLTKKTCKFDDLSPANPLEAPDVPDIFRLHNLWNDYVYRYQNFRYWSNRVSISGGKDDRINNEHSKAVFLCQDAHRRYVLAGGMLSASSILVSGSDSSDGKKE